MMNFKQTFDNMEEILKMYETIRVSLMELMLESKTIYTADDLISNLNQTPELYPEDVLHLVSTYINDAKSIRVMMSNFPGYTITLIDGKDLCIKGNKLTPESDAVSIKYKAKDPEYGADSRHCIIILGRKSMAYRDENTFHIMSHEITHAVLDYIKTVMNKDAIGDVDEEFLCDFIPIYYLQKTGDYINTFLAYSEKWFKPEVQDKYKNIIKDLIVYLNNEN